MQKNRCKYTNNVNYKYKYTIQKCHLMDKNSEEIEEGDRVTSNAIPFLVFLATLVTNVLSTGCFW